MKKVKFMSTILPRAGAGAGAGAGVGAGAGAGAGTGAAPLERLRPKKGGSGSATLVCSIKKIALLRGAST